MRTKSFAHALIAAALLAGCASAPPAPYGPAATPGASGFSDTQIKSDRYRVTYRAKSGGSARADDMALLRASEITLARGFDWFAVIQRNTEAAPGSSAGPQVSIGTGFGNYGRHTGVSIGTGVGFNLGGGKQGGAVSSLEIRLGKGAKPNDISAYDAREVERSIRPRL